jgi:MoxR-like ATPase
VIVGQDRLLERVLVALLAGGHILVEGVPGLAKTATVRAFASAIGGKFGRIQFTPDLVPSDLVGTRMFNPRKADFSTELGPIFCNLLLADEINRAPAKAQSALLEAMQERQVSIDGKRHALGPFFTVFATQNPVEHEGTYPLPEAQLDRFLLKVPVGYPSAEEEDQVLARVSADAGTSELSPAQLRPLLQPQHIEAARALAGRVQVDERVRGYIRDLMRATRGSPMIMLGAGPRAGVHLLVAARWAALLDGRPFVTPDDVQRMLHMVVCHRLILAPEVELDGLGAADVIDRVAASVPVPR